MTGIVVWTMVAGSWLLFIVGGLVIVGYDFSYSALIEDDNRLVVLAERWSVDVSLLASGWLHAGRSTAAGVASWLSGVERRI